MGMFKTPKPPAAPVIPPPAATPPEIQPTQAANIQKRALTAMGSLGGTFLGGLASQRPRTTGGKTLLGQ